MAKSAMDSAPRDGTRILAKCEQRYYNSLIGGYETRGYAVEHIYWKDGEWRAWCGTPEIQSTHEPHPVAWMHLPKELE